MTYPFGAEHGVLLSNRTFVDLDVLRTIKRTFTFNEKRDFITLYVIEGIPFAFKKNPLIFAEIRNWIAKHLDLEPTNITITGSSRLGFSLNPQKLGKPYQKNRSDLDLIVISSSLFEAFQADFKKYVSEVKMRIEREENIKAISIMNIANISHTMKRGFIDQFKIPANRNYPSIYRTYDVMYHLIQRMTRTKNCPVPVKASIRVYKDWNSCVNQLTTNLSGALISLK